MCVGAINVVVTVLSGADGLGSTDAQDVHAAVLAISSAMVDVPDRLFEPILSVAREKLDR